MLRTLSLLLSIVVSNFSIAQNVTGSWYGKADVVLDGNHNNYLTELILKQKGNDVEGVFGYYFKDSYQTFFIRGSFDVRTREVNINNIPVMFYASAGKNSIECPMDFYGTLLVSKVGNTLKGSFYSKEKYKYTCPELRVSFSLDKAEDQDSVLRTAVATKKFWKPQAEDFVVSTMNSSTRNAPAADDTSTTFSSTPTIVEEDITKKLAEKFSERKTIYSRDLEIESDSIRVSFYDNGDIDGDSISVFLNKTPILANQELTGRSLNIYLALDSLSETNEISMFADNLGKIPPNTALMVVSDGINRYELYLSSSLTQNAAVRLKRKKKVN